MEVKNPPVNAMGREDPPEEEMATHSSILAWEIPWTEKPGGLQKVGHDWVTNTNLTLTGDLYAQ